MRQNIDIPVPHRRRRGQGGLQGFSSGQNSTARFVEQNVDIPVPGGGLQFSLVLVVSAHPQFRVMSVEKGFFQTFSRVKKKSEVRRESESQGARQDELTDSGGLCGRSRPGTSTTSTSSTMALCVSRPGTISTSVTVGAKSVVKMATASCRCLCRLGSSSSALSDLEPPRYIVMAL